MMQLEGYYGFYLFWYHFMCYKNAKHICKTADKS